jgi:hypothetical protein
MQMDQVFHVGSPWPVPVGSEWHQSWSEIRRSLRANCFRRRCGYLYRRRPEPRCACAIEHPAAMQLRRLTDQEIASTTSWNVAEYFCRRRRAAGDDCYGIVIGGEVAYLHWSTKTSCYVRGADLLIALGPRDRYTYNVVVKPAFRRRGIYRIAQQQMLWLEAEQGAEQLITYIDANNHVARHMTEQMDFEFVDVVHSFRTMGLRIGNLYDVAAGSITRKLMNGLQRRNYWI